MTKAWTVNSMIFNTNYPSREKYVLIENETRNVIQYSLSFNRNAHTHTHTQVSKINLSLFTILNYIIMKLIEVYWHLIRSRNVAAKAVENNITRLLSTPSAPGFCANGILDQSHTYFTPFLGIRVTARTMSEMLITVIIVLSLYFVSGHEIVTFNPFGRYTTVYNNIQLLAQRS